MTHDYYTTTVLQQDLQARRREAAMARQARAVARARRAERPLRRDRVSAWLDGEALAWRRRLHLGGARKPCATC